jgi:hypothetical protein
VDVRTARFAEEVAKTRSKFAAYTVLAHPGHDQKSHGRKGGGGEPAELSRSDFTGGPVMTTHALYDRVAGEIAEGWDASTTDLDAISREGGWPTSEQYDSVEAQREAFVNRELAGWGGSSGGPVATEAIASVADSLGLDYELFPSEQSSRDHFRDNPDQQRVAAGLGRRMYERTQAWFAERGITHVRAVRMTRGADFDAKRPFTSWSSDPASGIYDPDTAGSVRREEVIPVGQIFSTPATGYGTLIETELIVLPG